MIVQRNAEIANLFCQVVNFECQYFDDLRFSAAVIFDWADSR